MTEGPNPPDGWSRIWEVFDRALEVDTPGRAQFLDEECGDDKELRREVQKYLTALHQGSNPLDRAPALGFMVDRGLSHPAEVLDRVLDPRLTEGSVLAERFDIIRLLGRGGMGAVYEAHDRELDLPVALKTLRPEIAGSSTAQERFRREIQLARQVTHPNVCRIYDLFRHGEALVFLSMELLRGETLAKYLGESAPLDLEEALAIIEQVTAGLEAAHQSGVVHRDFKTSNIILVSVESGVRAVITDFGLARTSSPESGAFAQDSLHLTQPGQILGTPAFMAPEQFEGGEITPATDVYALGVVLFEMVTAKLPFTGDTPYSVVAQHLKRKTPSPRHFAPNLDKRWESAILRCLKKDPGERYQRAVEVMAALRGESVPRRWTRRRLGRWATILAWSSSSSYS